MSRSPGWGVLRALFRGGLSHRCDNGTSGNRERAPGEQTGPYARLGQRGPGDGLADDQQERQPAGDAELLGCDEQTARHTVLVGIEAGRCSDCGDRSANASNMRSQTPFFAHLLKRLYTVVYGP